MVQRILITSSLIPLANRWHACQPLAGSNPPEADESSRPDQPSLQNGVKMRRLPRRSPKGEAGQELICSIHTLFVANCASASQVKKASQGMRPFFVFVHTLGFILWFVESGILNELLLTPFLVQILVFGRHTPPLAYSSPVCSSLWFESSFYTQPI